jgi:hypothetical protein
MKPARGMRRKASSRWITFPAAAEVVARLQREYREAVAAAKMNSADCL